MSIIMYGYEKMWIIMSKSNNEKYIMAMKK